MIISTNEEIKDLIYTIRGKQVMLDSDVARLYHYETKNINKAMKRNIERFPEDFCFQLTQDELRQMWFQNGTTSKDFKFRSEKYLPYAFTEQGIAMLSGVLKNDIAVKVSIKIIKGLIIDIIKRAKTKILIIENYIDDTILDMLSKKNKKNS
ncbi:MAG: ORF6N domain-containing protein [Clostridia bacterium]|nr:ORF6N domain-containing protein [Clostridia bacterium]